MADNIPRIVGVPATGPCWAINHAHGWLIPGTELGPYEIQSPLGAGGMGKMYRAGDARLDRTVAVKMDQPASSGRRGFRGTTNRPMIPAAPLRGAWRPRAEEWRRNTSVYPPCN